MAYECRDLLNYQTYGFTEKDLDKEFNIHTEQISGIMSEKKPMKLREILEILQKAYCGNIGADYMYISSREECNFMRQKFEVDWVNYSISNEEKVATFDRVAWAVLFEEFLQSKFTTHKRFGLEGLESMVSGLKHALYISSQFGIKDLTLGMAHRGRLNVLANVMKKPICKIFAEFQNKIFPQVKEDPEIDYIQSGDVKYHLGTFNENVYTDGKTISMDLLANPSHLEAVNPVVMGKTRAKQHFNNDKDRNKYMSILIHGDAAFSGQGIIYESMQMEHLVNYTIGGCIHIISNNQIGFTTSPKDGRSTPYVTDILKAYECPIIHVNADDPIAVDYAFTCAIEYRMKFKKDVAIDIIGYRKYGHNELDQPMFTQPQMYSAIAKKQNVLKLFQKRLIEEGVLTQEECDKIISNIKSNLEKLYKNADNNVFDKSEWVSKQWEHLEKSKYSYSAPRNTGLNIEKLREYNEKINLLPKNFNFHNTINKLYEARYNSIIEGKNIDMATAEALSFASLIDEGYTVRLSGEDVERGTFSHRHSVLHDQKEDKIYIPLKQIGNNPNNYQPCNSHLSEYAVLGFELGFSYYNPNSLVIWEAQFGDFANGAQIIIDNFIACGERKWNMQTGIVLNLPHGMDGQGPEHSSCRLERFLQMMDDDINDLSSIEEKDKITQIQESNYQVCYPTSSANYFHLLRRQLKRDFRKPLIIAMSKKLLKFKMANSRIEDFNENQRFAKVIIEKDPSIFSNRTNVKVVLVCAGQIYYDLLMTRENLKLNNFAIIAIEQIGPFPYLEFLDAISVFPNAKIRWVQEEHCNQGAWEYVRSRINNLLRISKRLSDIEFAGRASSSASATGFHMVFEKEHKQLMEDAFKL